MRSHVKAYDELGIVILIIRDGEQPCTILVAFFLLHTWCFIMGLITSRELQTCLANACNKDQHRQKIDDLLFNNAQVCTLQA